MKKVPIQINLGKITKLNSYKLRFVMDEKMRDKSIICKQCKNEIWLKQKHKIAEEEFAYLVACDMCYKEYKISVQQSQSKAGTIVMVIDEK